MTIIHVFLRIGKIYQRYVYDKFKSSRGILRFLSPVCSSSLGENGKRVEIRQLSYYIEHKYTKTTDSEKCLDLSLIQIQ